jgi:LemA protein
MIELIIAVGGLVVLLVIAMVVIGMYNNLVRLREQVRSAWAQIDVVLKRRYDLIPNLVETVKGYASHEKETLERVMQARNAAVTARHDPAAASQAEGMLTGALRQLFAVAEAYPDLKANTNFLELQRELASTENQISGQRQQYNNLVATYNTAILSFPTNLIAGPFGFTAQPFFEIQDSAQREAPAVRF